MPNEIQTFETTTSEVFEVNTETRTIKGVVVPFDTVGDNGNKFSFSKDTQFSWPEDTSRVKLLMGHDYSAPVGYAVKLENTGTAIVGEFKVARGAEGDRALQLAEDKVYDGLSMGLGRGFKSVTKGDVQHGTVAPISEVSLTPLPAFADSRVTSVAASAVPDFADRKGLPMPENTNEVESTQDFSALLTKIDERFDALNIAPREVVSASEGAPVQVTSEPLPYRFDGGRGEYDFSTDLFDAIRFKDGAAAERVEKFMATQNFAAVDSGDVTSLNPSKFRPDLYVDQAVAATPVYDALFKGTITDSTPFVVPRFGSASGLVSDHTEGTEPTDGSFTTGSQTVTPTAISGKADLTREIVDAGGNPQVSGLIWTQMQRSYAAALEAKAAALLNGATITELGTSSAGVTGSALGVALSKNLSLLTFVDGGQYFSSFLGHQDLYTALVTATDNQGRPLYPQLQPSNANGTTGSRYASINVGGWNITPAGSLGASGSNKKSYVFDPLFGGVWATSAQRITLPETVAIGASIGVFGYVGSAVLDANKIRKITY